MLGSASPDLLRQSSETLAGRISYLELPPLSVNEADDLDRLWLWGGFPESYLDLFDDLLLVRRLPPWHRNVGKRLVRSPRVFVRDTGLLHQLLGITDRESLLGHLKTPAAWKSPTPSKVRDL